MSTVPQNKPIQSSSSLDAALSGREPFYDALKAVAILLVVFGHALQTLDASAEPGGLRLDSLLIATGLSAAILAVSIFVYRILRRSRILALALFGESISL